MTATMALVFIESRDKKLYALEASTGRKVWEFEGNRRGPFFPMVHLTERRASLSVSKPP